MKKKIRVNWKMVEYLIRKAISKFGYINVGVFTFAWIEYGTCWETVLGLVLALGVGVLATLDLEDPSL